MDCSRPHTERAASSQRLGYRRILFRQRQPDLQDGGTNLLTYPCLKLREKQVLLQENNPNEMDSKVKESEVKNMLGGKKIHPITYVKSTSTY